MHLFWYFVFLAVICIPVIFIVTDTTPTVLRPTVVVRVKDERTEVDYFGDVAVDVRQSGGSGRV